MLNSKGNLRYNVEMRRKGYGGHYSIEIFFCLMFATLGSVIQVDSCCAS